MKLDKNDQNELARYHLTASLRHADKALQTAMHELRTGLRKLDAYDLNDELQSANASADNLYGQLNQIRERLSALRESL